MDIIEIIKTAIDTSAMAGLAIYAIWQLQLVWKQYNQEIYALREETLRALHSNTEAMTKLCMLMNNKLHPD